MRAIINISRLVKIIPVWKIERGVPHQCLYVKRSWSKTGTAWKSVVLSNPMLINTEPTETQRHREKH